MSDQGFFDFRERLTQRSEPAPAKEKSPTSPPLTVSQLTTQIELALKTHLPSFVLVQGEVSNFRVLQAGHFFFTLKDADTCIECTMWRSENSKLKFQVREGMEVILGGAVNIHRPQGKYRLYVQKLQPVGQGALELAFQQLCQKLQKEGLFDPKRKKPIPSYPMCIALITSAQAAALQDMLKILRRFSFLRVMVYPTLVQGQEAGAKIAAAIEHLNRSHQQIGGVDVILLARGGGSLEDLWAFNEEVVARAVAASKLPIITGIGHEVDVCIADLVADHHAHTPTEAAQVVTRFWRDADDLVTRQASRLHRELRQLITHAEQRLDSAERHEVFRTPLQRIHRLVQRLNDTQRQLVSSTDQRVAQSHRLLTQLESRLQQQRTQIVTRLREQISELRRFLTAAIQKQLQRLRTRLQRNQVLLRDSHPKHRLQLSTQRLGQADNRMRRTMTQDIRRRQQLVASMAARLEAINPKRVLQRGFSLTTLRKSGAVIRNAADLQGGDRLLTHFAVGEVESIVEPDGNKPD